MTITIYIPNYKENHGLKGVHAFLYWVSRTPPQ